MNRCLAFSLGFAPVCLVVIAAGCSSRTVEIGVSGHGAGHGTGPAVAARRMSGPIPEVIALAKPFRMRQLPQPVAAEGVPAKLSARNESAPSARVVDSVPGATPIQQATAASVQPGAAPDIAGIRNMIGSYLRAFNRHDPAALAAHWSIAGENVDLDSGETTVGREAVQEVFVALFTEDAGATIDIDIASIRHVRPDVAVVDGVSQIAFTDALPSSSRFSAVLVRQDDTWMLESVRESNVSVSGDAAAAPSPLGELAWLVGSWEDVGEGVTASTHCFWSVNKAFLIRSHAVSSDAAQEHRPLPGDSSIPGLLSAGGSGNGEHPSSREITEILGWDPERAQIRSWIFTSDGRFAEGSWSRDGERGVPGISESAWIVRLEGRGQDLAADCTYTLSRVGNDGLECRCSEDALADVMPPACDFVRTARAAATEPTP
ncbi:MAG: nuclear transport factor 2 family protein [Planctomycetes bacterium]|nr:nuclear transport factor 2 family protein [Planctomycetota bacterium]